MASLNYIKHDDLISEKYKKIVTRLWFNLLILALIAGCVSVSEIISLVSFPAGTTSSEVGLKICAVTAGISYNSINK